MLLQVLQTREGSISIKELSDVTAIKTDDIISTLQHLNLIQYQKGQHVICAAPSVIDRTLKAAGSPGLEVRPFCWPIYLHQTHRALMQILAPNVIRRPLLHSDGKNSTISMRFGAVLELHSCNARLLSPTIVLPHP